MSYISEPAFRSMVRASGLGEVWTHAKDDEKFKQFGWRCTNSENLYSRPSLIGNWNEESFDISRTRQAKPIPSQYNHYFETTYDTDYNKNPYEVPKELKHLKERHPHSFPGHQPEIDSAKVKSVYNSWETTTRSGYIDPKVRLCPLSSNQE
ncbi:hypothetical protein CHS0354_042341 [Potamilus streckersoni]|uniref:Uncharacterized protein n=1 Tax=Potamilus streckersoni TaxID=2493646 RepID=A0AAE0W0X8_9BIVA|nr:hypothetical protein CHS0354_042341 [Potamilus streckersoni]